MTRFGLKPRGLAALLICWPLAGHAALACDAQITPFNFGTITLRDGVGAMIGGSALISCTGGAAQTQALAYLTLTSHDAARVMTGNSGATLPYTISAPDHSGTPVALRIDLDASGSGSTQIALRGDIIADPASVNADAYSAADHASLAFCADITATAAQCDSAAAPSGFAVAALVAPSCTVSVADMDFGTIDPALPAPVDQVALIALSCTNASPFRVGLERGNHAADDLRHMENNGDLLAYGLFLDPAHSQDWGNTGTAIAIGQGTGGDQTLPVYGRIFANQRPRAGHYTDHVVVVLTY